MNKHLETFQQQGFVILPQLLSSTETEGLLAQISSVLQYVMGTAGLTFSEMNIDQMYMSLKNHDPQLKSRAYDLIQHIDWAFRLSAKEELVEFIQKISQTPLLMDYVSVRVDDNSNDRQLPFHQEFFGQISAECYTAWMPLQDINEKTGGLRVIPGSHLQGPVQHRFYGNYHGVKETYLRDVKPINISVKKGDVLIFHPNLFHGTSPSMPEAPIRWTLITRYNALKNIPYVEREGTPLRIEQLED